MRIDLQSGASETVLSSTFPPDRRELYSGFRFTSDRSRIRIANEVVVAWSIGNFMVGNWRTGALAIVEESVSW